MYFFDHKLKHSTFTLDLYSQTGFVFGSSMAPSSITLMFMAIYGGTFQGSNRFLLDMIVPPIAILFALLFIYFMYRCSRIIASSKYFNKEDHDQIKYVQLTTMDDDSVKGF